MTTMKNIDKDAEIGRTIREYQEQSERLGCLLSKMQRISGEIEKVQRAIGEGPARLSQAARTAAESVGDGAISTLFTDIAEAGATKQRLFESLHRQGVGRFIREDKG